jgi:hypothetical protein
MAEKNAVKIMAQQAIDAVVKYGTQAEAAKALGIPRKTLADRCNTASRLKLKAIERTAEVTEAQRLNGRVKELESQLKSTRADTLDDQYVKQKIIGLKQEVATSASPDWAVTMQRGKGLPGVPVTMWSDWHWGEVVNPAEIGGVNEFNVEIAHRRLRKLVSTTVDILKNKIVNPQFPGIVVNLGGDMVSGDIHDELSATNDMPMMPVVLDLFGSLRWALNTMADEFGRLLVPCVTGNHGRNTHKPRAKQRNFTNFDWLLYQFLAQSFEGDDRIQFVIPDGSDCLYSVYGVRHLLTHGDQFRGGDGMIGPIGPLTRGRQKKLSRNSATGHPFDVMVHGHFHTYRPGNDIIGNGSLKGYDEYAASGNFGFEVPQQALWFVHPEHRITQHWAIKVEKEPEQAKSQWVSWKD